VRGQLLFTPTSKLSVRLIAEYSGEDDTCCVSVLNSVFSPSLSSATARTLSALSALGYTPTATRQYTLNNSPQEMRTDQKAVSATVDWDLGWAKLTSITAWRYWHFDPLQDSDSTPIDIIQKNAAITHDWQLSQELRLASRPGRLTWQTGIYVFQQTLKDHYILNQFGTDASAFYTDYLRLSNPGAAAVAIAPGSQYIGDTEVHSDSAAIFAQANYKLTDRLTLTGGLRYTHDERHGVTQTSNYLTPYAATSIPFAYDVTVKGDNVSYLASATYRVARNVNVYGSFSTGYKAAGLNLNAAVTPGSPLVLQPEKVKDGELGIKQTLFAGRVSLDANLFWTILTGLQATITPPNGAKSYLANVGDIRARGVEFEGAWQATEHLRLSANGSYNDAVYTSYPDAPCPAGVSGTCNLTGKPVYEAPRWVANGTVRYETELGKGVRPYAQADYTFRSQMYGSADDAAYALIKAYSLVNFRLGARFTGRYDASLWVQNAFNTVYFKTLGVATIPGASAFGTVGQLGTPRTWGATFRADF
jgi:iron complex outermembrane receptor protein